MTKIAISTDSNSGISRRESEELGIFVLPMTFTINGQECVEGRTLKHADVFRLQREGAQIFTSQPAPGAVMEFWDEILEDYDAVIHIPMSSALSGSCETAALLAQEYDGRVRVIDNHRVSATLKQSCLDARILASQGCTVEEICHYLTDTAEQSIVYIAVDDIAYLKKGGRLKPSAAAVAGILKIKPVLVLGTDKLDCAAKPRGMKAARKQIIQLLEQEMHERFHAEDLSHLNLHAATSLATQDALEWKQQLEDHFGVRCTLDRLPLSIATHTGFGAAGAAITGQLPGYMQEK